MINADLTEKDLPQDAWDGMRSAKVITLYPGQTIYRIADSTNSETLWPASPWWMTEYDFRIIETMHSSSVAAHHEQGLTLGFLARSAVAVKQEYSHMDMLIRAVVLESINVFQGIGRTQHREASPNGMFTVTWTGWKNIRQLYIPGIGGKHGLTLKGLRAIQVKQPIPIASQQLWKIKPQER